MRSLLNNIDHIVVLMLENRSFDHMLGFLYDKKHHLPPRGQSFEGLTGTETNPGADGKPVKVFPITPATPNAYFMPGADPGEGYHATNSQLFGSPDAPKTAPPPAQSNLGFVKDYIYTLGWESKEKHWTIYPGTQPNMIMGAFTPEALPVLSGLARGYAVCDHWFASVPTETLPNRAFANAATSQGFMDDKTKSYTAPSIFGALSKRGIDWRIYGYDKDPLTRHNFPDTLHAPDSHFGVFADFQAAAKAGSLPPYTFLEPSWGESGNSQHPAGNVALGEQLIHDVYYALRNGPGWHKTLLVITYDECGGCYDHVPPPWTATPPERTTNGEFGFDFKRFGVRVPAVLVSPLVEAGTVFRVRPDQTPLDHTSILKTVEMRFDVPPLTQRDAAACDLGAVLTLTTPRTDDPLAGVQLPHAEGPAPAAHHPSHLELTHAELVSRLPVSDKAGGRHHAMPELHTAAEVDLYLRTRIEEWKKSRR